MQVQGTLEEKLPGYTPWEFVQFDESVMEHSVAVQLQASKEKVYQMLLDRVLPTKCLSIYDEHHVYEDDEDVCDYCLYSRWAKLPALQLMFTAKRYEKRPSECVKFASLVGMPVVGSFEIKDLGGGAVELQVDVRYQIPTLLKTYVGRMPVWANVDELLDDALAKFKDLAEK